MVNDIFIDILAAAVALLLAFLIDYSLDRQWDSKERERDQLITEHMNELQRLARTTAQDGMTPNDQQIHGEVDRLTDQMRAIVKRGLIITITRMVKNQPNDGVIDSRIHTDLLTSLYGPATTCLATYRDVLTDALAGQVQESNLYNEFNNRITDPRCTHIIEFIKRQQQEYFARSGVVSGTIARASRELDNLKFIFVVITEDFRVAVPPPIQPQLTMTRAKLKELPYDAFVNGQLDSRRLNERISYVDAAVLGIVSRYNREVHDLEDERQWLHVDRLIASFGLFVIVRWPLRLAQLRWNALSRLTPRARAWLTGRPLVIVMVVAVLAALAWLVFR